MIKYELAYYESLTDKELTDIAMMEAMHIMGDNEILPEYVESSKIAQADLYAALVNRVAKYNLDIVTQVKS